MNSCCLFIEPIDYFDFCNCLVIVRYQKDQLLCLRDGKFSSCILHFHQFYLLRLDLVFRFLLNTILEYFFHLWSLSLIMVFSELIVINLLFLSFAFLLLLPVFLVILQFFFFLVTLARILSKLFLKWLFYFFPLIPRLVFSSKYHLIFLLHMSFMWSFFLDQALFLRISSITHKVI